MRVKGSAALGSGISFAGAFRNCVTPYSNDDDGHKEDHESKLEVKFFSVTTLYYLVGPLSLSLQGMVGGQQIN